MNTPEESLTMKAYDLLKFTIPTINKLPRAHKFTFGDRIYEQMADLLEKMIEAHYAPTEEKYQLLLQINLLLEKIRFFLRLGHDLGFYSSVHLGLIAKRVDEIGRRVGGWMKKVPKPPKN